MDYDLLPLGLAYLLQAQLAVAMCRWHFHWLVDCILDLHRHLLLMPLAFWSIALRSVVLLLRLSTHLQDFEGLHLHRHHPSSSFLISRRSSMRINTLMSKDFAGLPLIGSFHSSSALLSFQ